VRKDEETPAEIKPTEFSGVDFAIGTVRGFRSWKVSAEGTLEPMAQSGVWLPGENRAVCNAYPSKEKLPEKGENESWQDRQKRVDEWKLAHDLTACEHGFYAYFLTGAEQDRYSKSTPAVHGIIEGYGEVVIGTKGFRAAKGRILAISLESHGGVWALEPHIVSRIRANYPGVAFFDSTLAMQAEFPADVSSTFEKAAA
jgi:hypothetical protein